ncbi:MAG: fumarate hydratase [Faecalibacterium prausnitzii]|nr:fumarate hydratase [Faecalibacterium prausnitzii]
MDFNKAALEMHETHHGKVGIVSKVEVKNRDDLSTAYTPGVAEPCRKIRENPDDVYKYTFKGNMVAVVSNGTAVLGLGDIGPEAGLPVMEGKAVLFKEFGGVDAFPICIDAHDAASVIAACKAIAPTFGGINLEDIKSPECFEIEETLERELDIPVFHDDQHGTAIVVTAALINALRVVGKKMEDVHIVLNGPGAAGTAIIKMLMTAGAKDIIAVDQFGTLYKGCNSAEAHKNWLGEVTNPRQIRGGLKEALEGADVFIGVSKPGILTTELCRTMNKDAIVFAMANPTPEIMPDEAKAGGVRVMATGRSDFPNQVNNVLCFPGLFKGALSVRARDINDKMKLAAAYAIADLITDDDRSEENIIPGAFDPRVAEAVANAVAEAARESGVAREALDKARAEEPWPLAKNTLDLLWSNLAAAKEEDLPICQDTGMACVFVELGTDVHIDGSFEAAIHEGVRRGYTDGYLRKSIVADPLRRGNTGDNTPAAITVHLVDGDGCTITVAPKGFGSENMSRIQMLKPADGVEGFKRFVIETVRLAGSNPCPPIVLGVGVGGSFDKVAYLAKKALLRPLDVPNPDPYYADLEKELLTAINELGIGPQGFGGRTTCLGLAIEQMPTHVAGLPVAVNVSCHVTRRASAAL